jgi:hypothetical protein
VTGTGFAQAEIDRQYDIGQAYFGLPLEVKGDPQHRCNFSKGNTSGTVLYAHMQSSLVDWLAHYPTQAHEKRIMSTDVLDNIGSVNIPKLIPQITNEPFHPYLHQFHPEIEDFSHRSVALASIFSPYSPSS